MALKNHSLASEPAKTIVDPLAGLDEEALLSLRQKIDLKLRVDLAHMNLAEEIGLQYRAAMILLDSVQDDKSVPANQRAQVLNSVRTTLSDIIKQQKIVYSAERLKRYESAFLKVLDKLGDLVEPAARDTLRHTFFDLYGEFLKDEIKVIE